MWKQKRFHFVETKIFHFVEVKRFHFVEVKKISFSWKSPRHWLTLKLKLKRFYPIIKMTTLKDLGTYLMTLKLDDSGCRITAFLMGMKK